LYRQALIDIYCWLAAQYLLNQEPKRFIGAICDLLASAGCKLTLKPGHVRLDLAVACELHDKVLFGIRLLARFYERRKGKAEDAAAVRDIAESMSGSWHGNDRDFDRFFA